MLIKKIRSIHFFPVKGMQGFEKENCILQKNKLIENDRQFALTPIPKQKTSYSTPWLPKKHFKQLVNQPTLAKISLKLLKTNPLVLKIDEFEEQYNLADYDRRDVFAKRVGDLSSPEKKITLSLIEAEKGGLSDTRDQWISIGATASADELINVFQLDQSYFRFRLNLWITTNYPFEELSWIGRKGKIGDAELEFLSPVGRCNAINLSAETGQSTSESLPQKMRSYFGHSNLGVFARVIKTGAVQRDDQLIFA